MHADFDLGLFREAFAAVGHDLIDVPRGLAEEAGDVPSDGFILVRERRQGFQMMAQAERMLPDGFDVSQGAPEAEVDALPAGRSVGADDGKGQGLVAAGFDLRDGGLGDAQALGDLRLRELRPAAEARESVGYTGVLHELGVGLLDLISEALAVDEGFDGSVGPLGGGNTGSGRSLVVRAP